MGRFTDTDRMIVIEFLLPEYREDLETAKKDLRRIERKFEALRDYDVYSPEGLCPGIETERERAITLVRAYEKKIEGLETEYRTLRGY